MREFAVIRHCEAWFYRAEAIHTKIYAKSVNLWEFPKKIHKFINF